MSLDLAEVQKSATAKLSSDTDIKTCNEILITFSLRKQKLTVENMSFYITYTRTASPNKMVKSYEAIFQTLIEQKGDLNNSNILPYICSIQDIDVSNIVKMLIDNNIDVNACNKKSPLMIIVDRQTSCIRKQQIKYLLGAKANINFVSYNKKVPLYTALENSNGKNQYATAKLLIEYQADVGLYDRELYKKHGKYIDETVSHNVLKLLCSQGKQICGSKRVIMECRRLTVLKLEKIFKEIHFLKEYATKDFMSNIIAEYLY